MCLEIYENSVLPTKFYFSTDLVISNKYLRYCRFDDRISSNIKQEFLQVRHFLFKFLNIYKILIYSLTVVLNSSLSGVIFTLFLKNNLFYFVFF